VGLALVFFQHHPALDPAWRMAIVTGLLGALTTFSTFSLETVALLQSGRWALGVLNTSLHLVGSLLLTWGGIATAQRLWPAAA
jgi:CrcB protein